jgi:hypothetical protein
MVLDIKDLYPATIYGIDTNENLDQAIELGVIDEWQHLQTYAC